MFQISEVQESPVFNGGRSFLALRPTGSSFGGMVALEIARQTTFRGLVLIGSCQSFDAVSGLLRP